MSDISRQTWEYLHGPDDYIHLSFPTVGVPRSFTALQYVAMQIDEIDTNENGIAIIDNDNLQVVLDGHLKGRDDEQVIFMSNIANQNWTKFSSFCKDHENYQGHISDINNSQPNQGHEVNQDRMGVMNFTKEADDIRSDSMIRASLDPSCPYSFPPRNRKEMIKDILSKGAFSKENKRWYLSWKPSFEKIQKWAMSEYDPSSQRDCEWAAYCNKNPEIMEKVKVEILFPFFSGDIATWPKTDQGRYSFIAGGMEEPDMILLDSIDGFNLSFEKSSDMGLFMNALDDISIRDIWKLTHVICHDFRDPVLGKKFRHELKSARMNFESCKDNSSDHPSLP